MKVFYLPPRSPAPESHKSKLHANFAAIFLLTFFAFPIRIENLLLERLQKDVNKDA